jgi:hypothetical protein
MIARTWTGTVHRADAEEYAEFITLSLWDSVDAIRAKKPSAVH